ncbi:MAG: pyruvate kinase [Desulfosarcina sp.]|nr:pyruvate kinase [Desulfosarcina sp.]
MTIRTKIVATIGPASNSPEMIGKLVSAGVNVARLNFSHGNYETHSEAIRNIRSISRTLNRPVGILLDLQGPKIRVGKLEGGKPVRLKRSASFAITSKPMSGTAQMVSTTYRNLPSDVQPGDTILLDDGLIRLQVGSTTHDTVNCKVINGGILKGVDYFALSFVRTADDLDRIKSMMKKQGANIPVIAKIEKPEAVENLEAILDAADGIMVARGDLGVEMRPELVPIIQKKIISATVRKNKPVITATQMLETMSVNPIPTRAEASDVANAIFDGTDAVMLSGETATGKYPVKAVQMMARIAEQSEKSSFLRVNVHYDTDPVDPVTHAVAQSAVNILQEINARCIVAFSVSGSTSKQISKQRPSKPVYAFTSRMDTYNRLSLLWGITPMLIANIENAARLVESSESLLIGKNCVQKGDLVVLVIGMGLKAGSTNIIKLHRVGHED